MSGNMLALPNNPTYLIPPVRDTSSVQMNYSSPSFELPSAVERSVSAKLRLEIPEILQELTDMGIPPTERFVRFLRSLSEELPAVVDQTAKLVHSPVRKQALFANQDGSVELIVEFRSGHRFTWALEATLTQTMRLSYNGKVIIAG